MSTYVISYMKESSTYGILSNLLGSMGLWGLHMTIAHLGWGLDH